MTLQAYLDNIKAQTGKTPEDFRLLAEEKGLLNDGVKTGEIVTWLNNDFGLGHGHAMAIVLTLKEGTRPRPGIDERVNKLFAGNKVRWRNTYDELVAKMAEFGEGFSVDSTNTYISLLRQDKKFGIIQVTGDRLDIGIKLKGMETTERFEAADNWNPMVTHRVSITNPEQIDHELMSRLKEAFSAANPNRPKVAAD